jgi:hypothetical protein
MPTPEAWMLEVAVIVFSAGGAFGGCKIAINGMAQRLKRVEEKVDRLGEKLAAHGERLARVEAQRLP